MRDIKFDWDDVLLMPDESTLIQSRFKDINLEYNPLFTAPMDTVVSVANYERFQELGINVCLPRGAENLDFYADDPNIFRSMSLKDFKETYIDRKVSPMYNICIDTANGHISTLPDAIIHFKSLHGDKFKLMVGNIANPKTLEILSKAGADYCRVGIGNGSGCLTTQQSAVGYPMGSLIYDCYKLKTQKDLNIKIVADGGFKEYADIIKALALGADYVMLGGMFNKTLESCAPTYMDNKDHGSWKEAGELIDQYDSQYATMMKHGMKFYKKFRGMSTKEVQRAWGVDESKIRTSEGVNRINEVTDTLAGWHDNFDHYLRSAMGYCGAENFGSFIGQASWNLITPSALSRFKK
jgi:IMP dehydrogenase/GMP reductase